MLFCRRWDTVLAQVRFLVGDLRHESCAHAFPWRRSHLIFHTCASAPYHLRQHTPSPAPTYPFTCTPHQLRQCTLSPAPVCATICSSVLRHLEPLTSSPTPSRPITCANIPHHLRQHTPPPAPVPRDRSAGPSRRQFRGPSWRLFLSFCLLLETM